MRIEEALAQARRLVDLPALVDALGGEPRFQELGPGEAFGPKGAAMISAAAEVGRFGSLPCLGIVATDPEAAAEWIARRAPRHGGAAAVIAIPAGVGRLTVAAGADRTSILAVDPDRPDGVALAAFRRLAAGVGGGRLATALRFTEILGGRRLDHHFFAAFRASYDRFVDEGPASAPLPDRRGMALLHLTRVLFLYFVQRKGWLAGDSGFLARQVDDHLRRRRHLQRDLLDPLFFGALNRPEAVRSGAVRRFGRIPFLNGGLFSPHPLERRWTLQRTNESWRGVFDDLFEHFHFTLDERESGDAIAPDMLGRVFEGLMAERERSITGTFYTPTRIVARIVRAGMVSLLSDRLGIDLAAAERRLEDKDPAARSALTRVRVLDPAVGSGAFLLGALDLLDGLDAEGSARHGERRRILRHQLYGIDLSAEGVRLAELRLWLASIQGDADGPEVAVEPLPNLDANLRQGDTLHDPRWLSTVRRAPIASARALAEARRLFAGESGAGKPAAWRALRAAETAAAGEALGLAERELERRAAAALVDARSPDLFGGRSGMDRTRREGWRRIREDLRRIRETRRRLAREGSLPWFDAPSAFGEVFAESGGFDLVVGNPPWVRGEELAVKVRERLAERYRWWRGEPGPFTHRPDLSVAFLERSVELCRPGGVIAMLVPTKVGTAGYGTAARRALTGEWSLDRAADLTSSDSSAFGAVTYPMAIVVRKLPPPPAHRTVLTLEPMEAALSMRLGEAPWVLRAPDSALVAAALRTRFPTIAEHHPTHLGVKSGYNLAFLDPPAEIDPDLVRPAARGRGIGAFVIRATIPLLYPHDQDGHVRPHLPAATLTYLSQFRAALERRADAGSGAWWALQRTIPASHPHRVAWPDLARRLEAVVLPREVVPLNSCYFAVARDAETALALGAWLNTTWLRALGRLGADAARGGFARFNARSVGTLPWATTAVADGRLLALAREAMAGRIHDDDLDDRVAEHLGLDHRDRRALRDVA